MEVFTGLKPFKELSRTELLKIKNQEALIPIIYSEIVSLLKQRFDKEYIINRLREMGDRLAEGLLKHWVPKQTKTIPKILNDIYKMLFYRKISVTKAMGQYIVRDKQCPVCYLEISDSDIPFCIVLSAAIQGIINRLHEQHPNLPEVECTTIASRSMGAKFCEHAIKIK
jgi:predicted hydrocarbon binding protein